MTCFTGRVRFLVFITLLAVLKPAGPCNGLKGEIYYFSHLSLQIAHLICMTEDEVLKFCMQLREKQTNQKPVPLNQAQAQNSLQLQTRQRQTQNHTLSLL